MVAQSQLTLPPRDHLASFCRRHYIRKLSLFGSILTENFGPDSDVDMLVEFEPGHVPGFAFAQIEDDLSTLIGRSVDLNTIHTLSPYFSDEVARAAQTIYGG